ncbi:hypothetical protein [Siphonobacter aquaeclarae]|uniref:hypothetical protein n=1 Tax=Siphonobacter aquaeclarae TaxID=563176 RepID=UPI0015A47D07|nr:hypothetical protein [Siphonobacter aquaeclarae]
MAIDLPTGLYQPLSKPDSVISYPSVSLTKMYHVTDDLHTVVQINHRHTSLQ